MLPLFKTDPAARQDPFFTFFTFHFSFFIFNFYFFIFNF